MDLISLSNQIFLWEFLNSHPGTRAGQEDLPKQSQTSCNGIEPHCIYPVAPASLVLVYILPLYHMYASCHSTSTSYKHDKARRPVHCVLIHIVIHIQLYGDYSLSHRGTYVNGAFVKLAD